MTATLEDLCGLHVSRETLSRLLDYVALLRDEAARQNLVSASTLDTAWDRHIVDSAQLMRFAPPGSRWADIGSGAGLPGIVLAILGADVVLVEPRKLRAAFLERIIKELDLNAARVAMAKVEQVEGRFDVITARAVAALPKLLGITAHLAHRGTLWVLPKGQSAKNELAEAERNWHYDLRVEPSCTHADSSILLLSNVRARRRA